MMTLEFCTKCLVGKVDLNYCLVKRKILVMILFLKIAFENM